MKRTLSLLTVLCIALALSAQDRVTLWPKGKMPNPQPHQIAAMTDEAVAKGFNPDKHRTAYIEWFEAPPKEKHNGGCMILISGGSYENCCDVGLIRKWREAIRIWNGFGNFLRGKGLLNDEGNDVTCYNKMFYI